jgi:peptidoglycan-N-acetylglucosamine deacetylase
MLERLIEHINGHDGVRWATFDQIAADFRRRYPRSGATRPESVIEQWPSGRAAD